MIIFSFSIIFLGLLLDLDERSNNAYVTTLSNILQRFELENRRKILTSPPQQFRFLSSPSITSEMRNVLKHLSSNLPRNIVPLWSASKKLKITKWTDCSPAADIVSSPPRSQPWINAFGGTTTRIHPRETLNPWEVVLVPLITHSRPNLVRSPTFTRSTAVNSGVISPLFSTDPASSSVRKIRTKTQRVSHLYIYNLILSVRIDSTRRNYSFTCPIAIVTSVKIFFPDGTTCSLFTQFFLSLGTLRQVIWDPLNSPPRCAIFASNGRIWRVDHSRTEIRKSSIFSRMINGLKILNPIHILPFVRTIFRV